MKFYWFDRAIEKNLTQFSNELEDAGFYGVLLPYVVNLGDYFVKIAQCLNPQQKLKYIVAIRPYTISPQYLAMIMKSFNEIENNRVWVNLVPGQTTGREGDLDGILGAVNDRSAWNEKKEYLIKYVKSFNNFCKSNNMSPTVCISGMKENVFSLVESYGDYNMVAFEPYIREKFRRISKPRIVSVCPFIIDDEKELEILKNDINLPQDIFPTTTKNLIDTIHQLKADGVDGVMFSVYGSEKEKYKIIQFVRENKSLFSHKYA